VDGAGLSSGLRRGSGCRWTALSGLLGGSVGCGAGSVGAAGRRGDEQQRRVADSLDVGGVHEFRDRRAASARARARSSGRLAFGAGRVQRSGSGGSQVLGSRLSQGARALQIGDGRRRGRSGGVAAVGRRRGRERGLRSSGEGLLTADSTASTVAVVGAKSEPARWPASWCRRGHGLVSTRRRRTVAAAAFFFFFFCLLTRRLSAVPFCRNQNSLLVDFDSCKKEK